MDKRCIYNARRELIGKNLSISYDKPGKSEPLLIVRGEGQYLYDENDCQYLDCVNNVAHVGHCHPAVVKAASAQLRMLNTNTRYLHPNLVEYAAALTATFPDPLSVCFFTTSGSEANDLALRISRAVTSHYDVVVLKGAYHGSTSSMIDCSPYKYDRKGGNGKSPFVHAAATPLGHDEKNGSAEYYAEDVLSQIKNAKNGHIAAFFAESLMGCAGQVEFPPGYLKIVYDYVRNVGKGLCIADEVQVGFGRIGSHFWGFESQDVIPDIVTLGKPIGNGFPMAAVVTTQEIANKFASLGMEYFNTCGGCTVSGAVGLAVLNVIKDEKLQQNALTVGNYIMKGLKEIQKEFSNVISSVRGRGLFIGIEFIDPLVAASVAIKLKEEFYILISVDGMLNNVLKLKPPMVITINDGDRIITSIKEAIVI